MRTSRTLMTTALAAVTGMALLGSAVAAAQEDDAAEAPAQAASAEELVDRLVELELELGDALAVEVDAATGEETLAGDFVGLQVTFENLNDQMRALFIDADESDGPVAAAVSDVARGMLTLENAVARLAVFEDHDLERALGAVDDDDVATGADALHGQLQVAIDSYEDAVLRMWPAYGILRDAPDADGSEQDLFVDRFDEARTILDETVPVLRALVGEQTTAVMGAVDRFDAEPGEARARSMTVTCIDRSVYPLADESVDTPPAGDVDVSYGDPFQALDCPDLPGSPDDPTLENRVTVSP